MMCGHVLIVDRDPLRRSELRTALGLAGESATELEDPLHLPTRVVSQQPDLLVVHLDGVEALEALVRARAQRGNPPPALVLVPPGRPDLRLAALRAGAEEATSRDTAPRILQARVRSLLRDRESALETPLQEDDGLAVPGLAEPTAPFLAAPQSGFGSSEWSRVGLLSVGSPSSSLARSLAQHLGTEVRSLEGTAGAGAELDLVAIDATGIQGDLAEGVRVLSQLAELRGRPQTRRAATLVLLPDSAVETAALALDLGASDVVTGTALPDEIALRARSLIGRRRLSEAQRDRIRRNLKAAVTDVLTGLPNRRHAEEALRRLAMGSRQSGDGFALLMLDIDHFKTINDRFGHAAGDRVLVEVARRLRTQIRPGDLLARYGGEEFLLALPGATTAEATVIAERLRRAVGGSAFPLGHIDHACDCTPLRSPAEDDTATLLPCSMPRSACPWERSDLAREMRVTISIGVASGGGQGMSIASLLERADTALYAAKRAGRNLVATAPEAA